MTIEELFGNRKPIMTIEDKKIIISFEEPNKKIRVKLGDARLGDTVKIGEREYIVIGQGKETTAVTTQHPVKMMEYGGEGDWKKSDVRDYCNGEFLKEVKQYIGTENIVTHTLDLTADDGSGENMMCRDAVSVPTVDVYRRYYKYLQNRDITWWTATKVTYRGVWGGTLVRVVDGFGIISYDNFNGSLHAVYPFLILRSSIVVDV